MKLNQKSCEPCSGAVEELKINQIKELLSEIPNWKLSADNRWIYREYNFKNFQQTLDFVNRVGFLAEEEGHHPNIEFTWGYCKISIQTHKISGLCKNDFILAAKINQLVN